jgi:hypothetical protein
VPAAAAPLPGPSFVEEFDESEWIIIDDEAANFNLVQIFWWMVGCAVWSKVIYVSFVFLFAELGQLQERSLETVPMPAQWEKRYVKTSGDAGLEVALVKRLPDGRWAALLPDGGVKGLALRQPSVVRTQPADGILYTPLPVLSDLRKQQVSDMVGALANPSGLPDLTRARQTQFGRILMVVLSLPVVASKYVRWSLRSPSRFGGLLGVSFLVYEAMNYSGIFEFVSTKVNFVVNSYLDLKLKLKDTSDSLRETFETWEAAWMILKEYVDPWHSALMMLAIGLMVWAYKRHDEEITSPASSAAGSIASTPPLTPRTEETTRVLQGVVEALKMHSLSLDTIMSSQNLKIEKMLSSHATTSSSLQTDIDDLKTSQLVESMRSEGSKDTSLLKKLESRLVQFETILLSDKSGKPAVESSLASLPEPSAEKLIEVMMSSKMEPLGTASVNKKDLMDTSVGVLIRKLKKNAETPQEIFLKALENYQAIDKDTLEDAFPPGYRERVLPTFLGDVYSTGKTGKEWAKCFINDRKLGDCTEARL